ncbi:hypothetical protein [Solibacillus sp. FSL H8-0538]|uniref:hypothetical protein n=1 Tax=Solibacillus sp. FSL H8-0538 TaxID=2921400 RepID=UPI0030F5E0BE
MSTATVFKTPGQDPVVVVGPLVELQVNKYLAAGWTVGIAMYNKHGIPIAPASHKLKRAEDIIVN